MSYKPGLTFIRELKILSKQIRNHNWSRRNPASSASSRNFDIPLDKDSVYDNYDRVIQFARTDPDSFWAQLAQERVHWRRKFDKVNNCDLREGRVSWFCGGKLNVSENCLDRNPKEDVALIWEKDEPGQHEKVTYGELLDLTCRIANTLLEVGVAKGDRVVLYLPTSPLAVATMLACARIGAMHCVVFAGFSANALAQRVNDAEAKVIVTADKSARGGKMIELKKIVDEALKQTHSVQRVLVWNRLEKSSGQQSMGSLDVDVEKMCARQSGWNEPAVMDSEDPLFMLYTSGSTGKPKGLVHSSGGYLTYASWSHEVVFDCSKGDIFACVADIGWVTGHTYLAYGPLSNGVTSVLFESTPLYPDASRYWEMVERLRINQFYAAPTAIRSLLKKGDKYPLRHDLSSLRTLGSVGEPINTEAWNWYHSVIGKSKCTLVDTWWQTETGGVMISPRPSQRGAPIIPTMAMRALPGIEVVLIDPETREVIPRHRAADGDMCITRPWPSLAVTIWGDHARFVDTYVTKEHRFYLTGDEAHQTEGEGMLRVTGRMDDVINISGHRLGTSEVEDAIDMHHSVSESAVIGAPHKITGEAIHAFITLKDESASMSRQQLTQEINAIIKDQIASFAQLNNVCFVPQLPKTRSGKIMRRILKKLAMGEQQLGNLGDTSTLADPSAVDLILRTMYPDRNGKQNK